MANPAFRASTTAGSASDLSPAILSPSSTAIGDVLTVVYTGYSSGTYSPTPTLPSGWTLLRQDIQTGSGYTVHAYTARFVTTAAGAQSFTFGTSMPQNSSYGCDLALVDCYNQDPTTPIDDSQYAVVPNGTTATSPAATATVANDLILCIYIDNGNTGAIPSLPSGLTSAVAYNDSTNGTGIRVGYASLPASGTTPTYTSTYGETVNPSSGVFGTMFTVLVKGAGTSGITATATQTDGADAQAATGTPVIALSAAQTDGADAQAATGAPVIALSAAQTDGTDAQAATGGPVPGITATAAQTDGADTQVASAALGIGASAAQTDGVDIQVASAMLTLVLSAAQTDGADTQFATGYVTFISVPLAEQFACQQAAVPQFYRGVKPSPMNFQLFLSSGTWIVPPGVNQLLVSATAAGGTPLGGAGQQRIGQQLVASSGDTIAVAVDHFVSIAVNGTTVLELLPGGPYGKTQAQAFGQNSFIPGFGSGSDSGAPDPALAVILWS